jgi:hypothetical protein
MGKWLAFVAAIFFSAGAATGQTQQKVETGAEIVGRLTAPVAFDGKRLSGPGADKLLQAAAESQFLIVIEPHNDHATPKVTSALFRTLHERHGFNYVAIEQDPFGMEAASAAGRRGRIDRIAEHARAYPYSYTFSTDEELQLLADAGRISTGRWNPVWGFDQVFGATLLLEELRGLAEPGAARAAVDRLYEEARAKESIRDKEGFRDQAKGHMLTSDELGILTRLVEIRALMAPLPGSRAAQLIEALGSSAEIYSYYDPNPPVDASGTPRGLLNNSVREELMKRTFMQDYRMAEAADGTIPKVVVKAGYYHTVRGLSDGSVFTLGTFLQEFAISNRSKAVSVQVLALREWWPTWEKIEQPYRTLLPSRAMDRATLVDLRPLRAHIHAGRSFGLKDAEFLQLRQLVFGVDFALFIPSKAGARTLTVVRPQRKRR